MVLQVIMGMITRRRMMMSMMARMRMLMLSNRGENKGTVKKCKGDSLNPRNTCFKTVNKKTKGHPS